MLVKESQGLNLILNTLLNFLWQVRLDNLDGNLLLVVNVESEFDLAGEAISECRNDVIVSNSLWHVRTTFFAIFVKIKNGLSIK